MGKFFLMPKMSKMNTTSKQFFWFTDLNTHWALRSFEEKFELDFVTAYSIRKIWQNRNNYLDLKFPLNEISHIISIIIISYKSVTATYTATVRQTLTKNKESQ